MKSFNLILVLLLIISIACEKAVDNDQISQQDALSIEEMEKSYELAKQYDDSLYLCLDSNQFCEDGFVEYCDSLFHFYDENYEHHHNNYSHQNGGDDHHHEYMGQDHHGNGMHGDNNGMQGDNHDSENGHNQESMDQMEDLREIHNEHYH